VLFVCRLEHVFYTSELASNEARRVRLALQHVILPVIRSISMPVSCYSHQLHDHHSRLRTSFASFTCPLLVETTAFASSALHKSSSSPS